MKHLKLFENYSKINFISEDGEKLYTDLLIEFFRNKGIVVEKEDLQLQNIGALNETVYELSFPISSMTYDGDLISRIFLLENVKEDLEECSFIEFVKVNTEKFFFYIEFIENLEIELY